MQNGSFVKSYSKNLNAQKAKVNKEQGNVVCYLHSDSKIIYFLFTCPPDPNFANRILLRVNNECTALLMEKIQWRMFVQT
jgi:hypothetical protein